MKIKISSGQYNIKLYLPTFFIKTKILWKYIYKQKNNDLSFDERNYQINKTIKNVRKIYKLIKEYIEKNGHFLLLEVENRGNNIKIIL